MKLAIDTNRYRDLCEGKTEVVRWLEEASAVYVPLIVLAELRAGFALGQRTHQNERQLLGFLATPGVQILAPTESTTRAYATLFRQLRHQGTPIPTNDIWIAALVVEHQLVLCTRDRHFDALPQLQTL